MHPRPILSAGLQRKASLAPIYLAITCLVSVSVIGLAVASWPRTGEAPAYLRDTADGARVSPLHGDVMPFPTSEREARHKGKWT